MSDRRETRIETLEPLILMNAVVGTDGADWIAGTDANDVIDAGDGNDVIYAPIGTNLIDGGDGDDLLVVYGRERSEFELTRFEDGRIEMSGPGLNGGVNANSLLNVEQIEFNDGILQVDSLQIESVGDSQSDLASEPPVQTQTAPEPERDPELQPEAELPALDIPQPEPPAQSQAESESQPTLQRVVVAQESFENGADGWSLNSVGVGSETGEYLGGFSQNDVVEKTFQIPDGAEQVDVSFEFLEIDSWDGEHFYVILNGRQVDLGSFQGWSDEGSRNIDTGDGIQIQIDAARDITGIGSDGRHYVNDNSHRVNITIDGPGELLTIGFASGLDQSSSDEAFGIDDLLIESTVRTDAIPEPPSTATAESTPGSTQNLPPVEQPQPANSVPPEPETQPAAESQTAPPSLLETPADLDPAQEAPRPLETTPSILAEEDFENEADGWSLNFVDSGAATGQYLGRFHRDHVTQKEFDIPENVDQIVVSFSFLEIDSWDHEHFWVYVDGQELDLGDYHYRNDEGARSFEFDNGISVQVDAAEDVSLGSDGESYYENDNLHRVTMTIQDPGQTLTLGFKGGVRSAIERESFGIDDLLITTTQPVVQPETSQSETSAASAPEPEEILPVVTESAATEPQPATPQQISASSPGVVTTSQTGSIILDIINSTSDPSLQITEHTAPQHGTVTVTDSNVIHYQSAPGYSGIDFFDYVVSENGRTSRETIVLHVNTNPADFVIGSEFIDVQPGVATPIVFDLNNDQLIGVTGQTTAKDKSGITEIGDTVQFDIDADGDLDTIEWVDGSGDGILVDVTKFSDTSIDGSALFGSDGDTFEHGYQKLAQLDVDGNRLLDEGEFASLRLWVDDGDGVLAENELQTLEDHRIFSISTRMTLADGGLMQSSAYTTDDGRILTEDVWFAIDDDVDDDSDDQDDEVNTPPEAATDVIVGNAVLAGNVLSNDRDADGDSLSLLRHTRPIHGMVTLQKDGSFSYTPDSGFTGIDYFQYEVSDGNGGTDLGVALLTVTGGSATTAPANSSAGDGNSINGVVWHDAERNGIRESTETERGTSVFVNLLDSTDSIIDGIHTDKDGRYSFDGLTDGAYRIRIAPSSLPGFESLSTVLTLHDVNGNFHDEVDSDVHRTSKKSTIVHLGSENGATRTVAIDAGYFHS